MATRETPTKQTVAILGPASRMGWGMAKSLARAGHHVLLAYEGGHDSSPSAHNRSSLVAKTRRRTSWASVSIVTSTREASWEADIIVPVVPFHAQAEIARGIQDVACGKIVISVINPLNTTCDELLTAPGTSAAELLAQALPNSKIIKAFNTLQAAHLERPLAAGKAVDVLVAGDDDEAVSTVMQLVGDMGLHPVFVGRLAMSRALESMMLLLISLCARNHFLEPVGWKLVHGLKTPDDQVPRNHGNGRGHAECTPAKRRHEKSHDGNHRTNVRK